MPEEIGWGDYDELAADRGAYTRTQDPAWLPVIAELERKLGLQPGLAIPAGPAPSTPFDKPGQVCKANT